MTNNDSPQKVLNVLAWGTYDLGKPRSRILLRGLRENGVKVTECHAEVWSGIEDKSQVKGVRSKLKIILRWLFSYPMLIWRFMRAPKPDVVLIGYLGQFDTIILWPFAKLRGVPIVLDVFLSLYNTIVEDRKLFAQSGLPSRLVYAVEYLAVHSADHLLMDTQAHAQYICDTFNIANTRISAIPVGAEPEHFSATISPINKTSENFTVLFYGQFIPLHGIETIIRAAALTKDQGIHWRIIGTGQEADNIRQLIDQLITNKKLKPNTIEWTEWVEYPLLIEWLQKADVALGIFGDTDKARRVIPNKVYQILLAGRPLITADTMAARELLSPNNNVQLVPEHNPQALADAVLTFKTQEKQITNSSIHSNLHKKITPFAIGGKLVNALQQLKQS